LRVAHPEDLVQSHLSARKSRHCLKRDQSNLSCGRHDSSGCQEAINDVLERSPEYVPCTTQYRVQPMAISKSRVEIRQTVPNLADDHIPPVIRHPQGRIEPNRRRVFEVHFAVRNTFGAG
jgi:hypothetical protein